MNSLVMHNDVFLPQVVELIEEGHEVTLMAKGNSMRPFIEDGRDKLVFGKVDKLSIGDVILAEPIDGVFVCHRIEKMDNGIITMRGDGNISSTETFTSDRVRAKLLKVIRLGKTYNLATSRKWKMYSAVWTRLLPARRYFLALYRLLWLHQMKSAAVLAMVIASLISMPSIAQDIQDVPDNLALALAKSNSEESERLYEAGNIHGAINLEIYALNYRKKVLGEDSFECFESFYKLLLYYSAYEDYKNAISYGNKAISFVKKNWGTENEVYPILLYYLSMCYGSDGNYISAIELGNELLTFREKTDGKEHPNYATALNNVAQYYNKSGNNKKAIELESEALKIREKTLGKEHLDYFISLNSIILYNLSAGDYKGTLVYEKELLEYKEKMLGTEHPDYISSLDHLVFYNYVLGDYSSALEYGKKALSIKEKVFGEEHAEYLETLDYFGKCYYEMGNYYEGRDLEAKSLRIKKKLLGEEHADYATSLYNLSYCYYGLGDYNGAIDLGNKALKIRESLFGKDNEDYAMSLASLMIFNTAIGKHEEALRLGTEAQNILDKTWDKEGIDYANFLGTFSRTYHSSGDYKNAIETGIEALRIMEMLMGKDNLSNTTILSNIAAAYYLAGDYNKAIEFESKSMDICRKSMSKEHPNYAINLHNLAGYYAKVENVPVLTSCITESKSLIVDFVCKNFANLTTRERNTLWQRFQNMFAKTFPEIAYTAPTDTLIVNAYDGILFNKGLLLNSEIEMAKLLLESGDEETVDTYKRLQQIRLMLNRLYEKPLAEQQANVDSIERVATRMERQLVKKSKIYGDYTRNLSISWRNVQQRLGKNDIAVEFVSFPYNEDSTIYVAYVLDAKMSVPQMVTLFEEKQLIGIPVDKRYTTNSVGELVWGQLKTYLSKAENVYFAPSGELYNIAIESLPDLENPLILMSDRWNFYRLSSTRELAVMKDKKKIKDAALYGGLMYDTNIAQMEADSRKYRKSDQWDMAFTRTVDELNLRSGVKYLPATKTEVEHIDSSMKQASINSSLFTDDDGTEASFKNLSGKKMNILHIATHGFYWSEQEALMKDHLSFLMQSEEKPRLVEDKSMTRSGLLLSGANNAMKGKELPENVEDGILTAQEISLLDLRELELVVLSACQTGLGKITGEGVFGLQRGFKKAGANTILMSLWEVPDTPTQLLMTRFYENLLINKNPKTRKPFTKLEALKDAQQYVRNYEENDGGGIKPYENPENWAAFILLDAMD